MDGIPPPDPRELKRLRRELKASLNKPDQADLFGEQPPEALLTPYPFDWDATGLPRLIQPKYMDRARNIRRSWNRIQLFAPELLAPGAAPCDVFEMSTAHGGMLEVARHFGHRVLGNDYLNFIQGAARGEGAAHRKVNEDVAGAAKDDYNIPVPAADETVSEWCYRPIIEAMDIPISLFDGGKLPYPLPDKSQDYIFCMQAIEHYCHPDSWGDVVAEFCRIARRAVIVLLNKNPPHLARQADYVAAFDRARLALRNHDAHGFRCVSVHMHWHQALGFRLQAV